uniref:Uncharacterized protein n=1 Tax=Hemiselmis andersenii TaxID=464988 RepID=A0A7S0U6L6_HEMAN
MNTARDREIANVFGMYEAVCEGRKDARFIPSERVADFFAQIGTPMREQEVKDLVLELGDGEDGILYHLTVEHLSGGGGGITDQMIDAVFVDIDKEDGEGSSKYDNVVSEDEVCAKLAGANPFFGADGPMGGAEQLTDWLDYTIASHKIQVTVAEDGSRCFTPHTFRLLMRLGTALL